MKYERVASYVSQTLWALEASKLAEIVGILAFRSAGHEFTPAEIQARLDAASRNSQAAPSAPGIAVIPIRGVIAHRMSAMEESSGGASAEGIGKMVDRVAADDSIGTIVYDVDTPGGTVPGVQELAAKMFALRGKKTQIAQINSLAASAGYWLASQADEIVSIPSGSAGSIGVFTAHADLSAALEKEGVKVTVISAGKFKTERSPFGPLSEEAQAQLQADVDRAYAQFVADVARGRGVSAADVKAGYGQGRVVNAQDAIAAGLIDRVSTFEATVASLVNRTPAAMRADSFRDRLKYA